jgi:predicted Fe-Mo cluster-binding NifX family protein
MNKRIAIPMAAGKLSAHFGHCEAFAFVDVQDSKIVKVSSFDPPEHQPGTFPRWVAAQGATDVLAGGMGPQAVTLFNQAGVNVFVGAPIKSAEELVEDFLNDRLSLSANYCDHDGEGHQHGHDHHH